MFGGVDRITGQFFLVPVERRNEETLLPLIKQYIKPGTTIMSDKWAAYNKLGEMGYKHLTVNHSKHFKDPRTGACTNLIEGLWRHVKNRLPAYRRSKKDYLGYLAKYMFIVNVRRQNKELLPAFLTHVSEMHRKYELSFAKISKNEDGFDFTIHESDEDDDGTDADADAEAED